MEGVKMALLLSVSSHQAVEKIEICSETHSERTQGNQHKLQQWKFWINNSANKQAVQRSHGNFILGDTQN